MTLYVALVGFVVFAVNILLLLGTNRLLNAELRLGGVLVGALVATAHATVCLLSGFAFLKSFWWSIVFIAISAIAAFGMEKTAAAQCYVFALLRMALSWLTVGAGGSVWMPLFGAVGIYFLCNRLIFREKQHRDLLPVELSYKQQKISIWALRDTGNTLKDPVSGKPVLVIGPKAACRLTGLTQRQLENPVETMGVIPGLRLIPYHSVGMNKGLLLGMKLADTKIGNWQGSSLVAFAPCGLGERQAYQALTGGNL